MKTVAVIAEYNPFHRGHAYHIEKIREELGEDSLVIAVMSGNYTQRGELAIADKFTRAEAAVLVPGGQGDELGLKLPSAAVDAGPVALAPLVSFDYGRRELEAFGSLFAWSNKSRTIAVINYNTDGCTIL